MAFRIIEDTSGALVGGPAIKVRIVDGTEYGIPAGPPIRVVFVTDGPVLGGEPVDVILETEGERQGGAPIKVFNAG